MMSTFFSIALTLFFVIDALGNLPVYLSFLKKVDPKKVHWVAARELFFALIIMFIFHYLGEILLSLLNITRNTVEISGGIILFLIAIRLIFSHEENNKGWGEGPPFIVPIATPLIAGPSVLSVIMIHAQEEPNDLIVLAAIVAAWLASSVILFFAKPIYKALGEKVLIACQRLMGLVVALIAVQMFLIGVDGLIKQGSL